VKKEKIILLFILLLAAFLRLYKIQGYLTFLGDEGRDVLVVKRLLLDHKLTLLGPTASVGGFFLGPFYYYLIAPFLWLFGMNPIGPAVMVALFGVATVWLIYFVGKRFFDVPTGLLAAGLYAISPVVITYSHSSWNPNLMPFFSLLIIWFAWQATQKKDLKLLGLIGFLFGLALQLHYLTVFLMAIVGIYWLFFGQQCNNWRAYFWLVGGFAIGWSPFLAFELRHNFPNFRSLVDFLLHGEETGFVWKNFLPTIGNVSLRLFERLVVANQKVLAEILLLLTLPLAGYQWVKQKGRQTFWPLLGLWLVLGIGLFGFYQDSIYDYYFGFMFPLPFLLTAFALVRLAKKGRLGCLVAWSLGLLIIFVNWQANPFYRSPNYQLRQAEQISRIVYDNTSGQPFNFALITGQNSDHAYRYFLELWGARPVTIEGLLVDPERRTVTDQLLVVCEVDDCHPLGHSLWEIAGFGRAEIVDQWSAPGGITVMRLIHWEARSESPED